MKDLKIKLVMNKKMKQYFIKRLECDLQWWEDRYKNNILYSWYLGVLKEEKRKIKYLREDYKRRIQEIKNK